MSYWLAIKWRQQEQQQLQQFIHRQVPNKNYYLYAVCVEAEIRLNALNSTWIYYELDIQWQSRVRHTRTPAHPHTHRHIGGINKCFKYAAWSEFSEWFSDWKLRFANDLLYLKYWLGIYVELKWHKVYHKAFDYCTDFTARLAHIKTWKNVKL